MKKRSTIFGILLLACAVISGCSSNGFSNAPATTTVAVEASAEAGTAAAGTGTTTGTEMSAESTAEAEAKKSYLPDGVYTAEFDTDNSMFRVTEAHDGIGKLTVENGEMTIHVSLGSKNIVNLYPGLAEDAKKDGAELLEPTIDSVTYNDGWTEDVYGFDIPVPVIGEEFDVALIGKKGKWYDHKVIVSNPEPYVEESAEAFEVGSLEDGSYTVALSFEGGSGKAEIVSPATITVSEGTAVATVQWNSPNYDYMIVDGEKYLPVNEGGDSVFEIPVSFLDVPMDIIGDTVAMSKPHEIEYVLTFHSETIEDAE